MDGTLHTDFQKSETSRDIKKHFGIESNLDIGVEWNYFFLNYTKRVYVRT